MKPDPSSPARPGVSPWWRALAVLLLIVLLLGGAASTSMYVQLTTQIRHWQLKNHNPTQLRHLAVLQDAQGQPAMLVTLDTQGTTLELQRLNNVQEGREDSMQLWALRTGEPPQSLGVIGSKLKTLQLEAASIAWDGVTQLAISVEDKGGVTQAQGPRLPYLFTGWLVRKAL